MGPPSRYYNEPPFVEIGNYNFTDDTGAQAAYPIYTVTGDVIVQVFAICKASLTSAGAPTVELGVSGNTAALITQIVDGTDLLINEIWHDATPTTTLEALDIDGARTVVISAGQDIIFTVGTADLTAGDIDFYCLWRPLSRDGKVVAV